MSFRSFPVLLSALAVLSCLSITESHGAVEVIPSDSNIGTASSSLHRELISAVEQGEPFNVSGSKIQEGVSQRSAKSAQAGATAIEFTARAEDNDSKLTGMIPGRIPPTAKMLGIWIYRDKAANIRNCGFEVADAEGEMFICTLDVPEGGWHWMETELTDSNFKAASQAKDKNGKLDLPLRNAGVFGFAERPGTITLAVDAFVAACEPENMDPLQVRLNPGATVEPGESLVSMLILSNRTEKPLEVDLDYSVQQDSSLANTKPAEGEATLKSVPKASGKEMEHRSLRATVPPRNFEVVRLVTEKTYGSGSYLLGASYKSEARSGAEAGHVFVLPEGKRTPGFKSRFGINVNNTRNIPQIQQLGMGWVRFENLKWPMMNKQPDVYAFDGSVGPVSSDAILAEYAKNKIEVLPFLFETARYAAPDLAKKNFNRYPPKDNSLYAQFCSQVALRYGAAKHPAKELLTPDKASGLQQLKVVELWNEPNLQDPGWGHWIGTTAQYLELMRAGAEAVRKADPKMLISPGGWAGIDLDYVAELGSYTYKDGTRPIDYVDLINVHHYTGQAAPELARVNTNIQRDKAVEGKLFQEKLDDLVDWRDELAPGKEIWMSETGYDTGGPRWVTRRDQAAFLARNLIMILGAGVDKVFIYRITGDSPGLYAASGLLAAGDGYKPSFFTTATLIRQVDLFDSAIRIPSQNPDVRLYLFEKGNVKTLAAWALKPGTPLGLDLGKATVVDSFGFHEERMVNADQTLGDFPLYFTEMGETGEIENLRQKALADRKHRKDERAKAAKIRTYLFDFGSKERVGGENFGNFRRYIPVVASDVFDEKVGYGFEAGSKVKDLDAHWIKDLINRDSCRVDGGGGFLFQAEPGKYKFSIRANPFTARAPASLIVESGGKIERLEVKRGDEEREVEIRLDGKVTVRAQQTADVFWIKAVKLD